MLEAFTAEAFAVEAFAIELFTGEVYTGEARTIVPDFPFSRSLFMLALVCIFALLILSSIAFWTLIEAAINKALPSVRLKARDWNLVWAGLLGQCAALLAISLIAPLSGTTGVVFWGAIWILVSLIPSCRERLVEILAVSSKKPGLLATLMLTAGVGLYASQAPCNYDTLLYHHQATQWFSEHGAVRGLALLHFRFGFISSTFALAAPFESWLPHRTGTLVNGTALLIAMLQITSSVSDILSRRASAKDWFTAFGLSSVLALHLLFLEPVSAAPDFLVNIASMAIAVGLIGRFRSEDFNALIWTSMVAAALLPLVKLSAAPVAAVVALVFLFGANVISFYSRAAVVFTVALLAAAPLVSISWWQSGNLLFPVSALQTTTSWTHPDETLREISHEIRDWARWGGKQPEGVAESEWILRWLKSSKGVLFLGAAVGNLLAILAFACLGKFNRLLPTASSVARYEIAIPIIGVLGSIYLFYAAPNPRFGFGMLMMGWAWLGRLIGPIVWQKFCCRQAFSEQSVEIDNADSERAETNLGEVIYEGTNSSDRGALNSAASSAVSGKLSDADRPFQISRQPSVWGGVTASLGCIVLLALCAKPMDAWRKALNAHLNVPLFGEQDARINWLRPAVVPTIGYQRNEDGSIGGAFDIEFIESQVNDVQYSYPTGTDITGARALPAANQKVSGIRLGQPDRGIRGGFIRAD